MLSDLNQLIRESLTGGSQLRSPAMAQAFQISPEDMIRVILGGLDLKDLTADQWKARLLGQKPQERPHA